MTANVSNENDQNESPAEIIVQTYWAEEQLAKGNLTLTPVQIAALDDSFTISLPASLVRPLLLLASNDAPIEWIEPLDAVHLLSSKLGGDAAAKLAIAERLRDGAIKCSCVWMAEGPDFGPISPQRPKFGVPDQGPIRSAWVTPRNCGGGLTVVGGAFWTYSENWDDDLKRWNWASGLFVACRSPRVTTHIDGIPAEERVFKKKTRMVVSGVRFDRADIEAIVPCAVATHEQAQLTNCDKGKPAHKKGRTGPRPKKFNFGPVLARYENEILDGRIYRFGNLNTYGVQADLERAITLELTSEDGLEPAEVTVRRRVQKLMEFWRLREAGQL